MAKENIFIISGSLITHRELTIFTQAPVDFDQDSSYSGTSTNLKSLLKSRRLCIYKMCLLYYDLPQRSPVWNCFSLITHISLLFLFRPAPILILSTFQNKVTPVLVCTILAPFGLQGFTAKAKARRQLACNAQREPNASSSYEEEPLRGADASWAPVFCTHNWSSEKAKPDPGCGTQSVLS